MDFDKKSFPENIKLEIVSYIPILDIYNLMLTCK